jgi:hypothetical protein
MRPGDGADGGDLAELDLRYAPRRDARSLGEPGLGEAMALALLGKPAPAPPARRLVSAGTMAAADVDAIAAAANQRHGYCAERTSSDDTSGCGAGMRAEARNRMQAMRNNVRR